MPRHVQKCYRHLEHAAMAANRLCAGRGEKIPRIDSNCKRILHYHQYQQNQEQHNDHSYGDKACQRALPACFVVADMIEMPEYKSGDQSDDRQQE